VRLPELVAAAPFVAASLRFSVPYVLAALGGTFSERAGVVNLALEGLLLGGAFAATLGAWFADRAWAGVLAGGLSGMLLMALYALFVLRLGADQIVTGVALNLFVDGLSRFFLKSVFDSSANSPRIDAWGTTTGSLADTVKEPLVLGTIVLVALGVVVMNRMRFGLRIRAVGDVPAAAASLGVSPLRVRAGALLVCGVVVGLGGAWLAADQRQFVAGMSRGRGYIALAAMIFGGWRPLWGVAAALFFGVAATVQNTMQAHGTVVPDWAVQMMPYVLTLIALLVAGRRNRAPTALGRPWSSGQ